MNDVTVNWIDRTAIGRPQSHDGDKPYNPPAVLAPAMSQEQLDYDNQRQIEDAIMLQPTMLAFVISDLKHRVKALEEQLNDNRTNS